jgi:hypothetical protein
MSALRAQPPSRDFRSSNCSDCDYSERNHMNRPSLHQLADAQILELVEELVHSLF